MTAPVIDGAELARKAHRTLEPLHIIVYFSPEPSEAYAELGIKGSMRGYFASRSAALGRVPAEVVIATFFNFSPDRVRRAIPAVWDVTTPEAVLEARLAGADRAYRRILGAELLGSDAIAEAAALAREATTVLGAEGHPLYAAHAALPWPEPPHLQLFHAQTLLREHRGDAHIAALVLAGLGPVEAMINYEPVADGLATLMQRETRGWPDEAWEAAADRLRDRGLLAADGTPTEAGAALRATIEAQTDAADAAPYLHLGVERTQRLRELARPWSRAIAQSLFGGTP
ncbi:MAG TPA: hypothetical protein VME70_14945 [Mycobacteriales bacterium]|nr:hypothetical protein [Mycobacteriales bacterium]